MGEGIRAARGFSQSGLGPVARFAATIIPVVDALNQADKVQRHTRHWLQTQGYFV